MSITNGPSQCTHEDSLWKAINSKYICSCGISYTAKEYEDFLARPGRTITTLYSIYSQIQNMKIGGIVPIVSQKVVCNCDIIDLLKSGCMCGSIKRY